MYDDIRVTLAVTTVFIVLMFASYPVLKKNLGRLERQGGIFQRLIERSARWQRWRWPIRGAVALVLLASLLMLWPETLYDGGTLSKKVFDQQGKCVLYTLNPVGVLSEGYRIDPAESVETAFLLHTIELDNPFSVRRRADLPEHGPIDATDFSAGFAVTGITGTVLSIEPWEHGYLMKLAEQSTQFRIWSFRTADWEQQLRDQSLLGKKLTIFVNQRSNLNRQITEATSIAAPIVPRRHILEDGKAMG